ncbi:OB-fold domain-containing protein [Frankia sp. CNm7]|uniref:OB-fold domain-containing protein n=1 Tax=Frankia nepalensis TaxID=1836974 RepID=A0A937UKZ3_9ACTN|nr:OB-fold domain-containing protein [Frankia nepalensis]MBL7496400.1 OB-fold domain-containing protein [Frankia nepalensis]MBL7511450.1 OB-fold domain-containing protein [Frankia nepalensis]MBL7523589.1 OB-fold domain-containing protein [Frankia nepalensis]MBL7627314.1 OB-fold domain-containing protein [Frankia nepalensis]
MPRVIRPVPDLDDAFFWEAARDGRLVTRACAGCGRIAHPPSPMCPACGSVDWTERELSGRGTIHSWIVSRHPSQPDDAPRIVILVDLEEGIRLVSNLREVDAADVSNEMPVEVFFDEVDGFRLPQFRPAAAQEVSV